MQSLKGGTTTADLAVVAPAAVHATNYKLSALSSNWGETGLYLTPRPNIPENIMNEARCRKGTSSTEDKRASTAGKSNNSRSTTITMYAPGSHCQSYVKLPGYWTHERSWVLVILQQRCVLTTRSAILKKQAQDKRITETQRPNHNNVAVPQDTALTKARKELLAAKKHEDKENKSRHGIRAWFRRMI
jgi:hypothetical protein